MPRYDFRSPRLFIDQPLRAGSAIALDPAQAHYLADVLRLAPDDHVLVFNGRDGEWQGTLGRASKKALTITPQTQTRPQTAAGDVHYLFAPLKRARLDYIVQKAVEMGVSRLAPVMTRHTQAERVNVDRMRANAIEAAEQCGILSLPEVVAPQPLAQTLAALGTDRLLVFCDEEAEATDPVTALAAHRAARSIAVLIGPEGGFADDERKTLLAMPRVVRLPLGPRILRADTAAVAALTLVQSVLGDWKA